MFKKLTLVMVALFVASVAMADLYTVTVSTHNPTTEQGQTDGSYPDVDGNAKVGKITIANSADVVQTVSVYENASSSTTATLIATGVIASTGTIVIDLEGEQVTDLGIKCSDAGSTVNATVKYK